MALGGLFILPSGARNYWIRGAKMGRYRTRIFRYGADYADRGFAEFVRKDVVAPFLSSDTTPMLFLRDWRGKIAEISPFSRINLNHR